MTAGHGPATPSASGAGSATGAVLTGWGTRRVGDLATWFSAPGRRPDLTSTSTTNERIVMKLVRGGPRSEGERPPQPDAGGQPPASQARAAGRVSK
jgi:hypothetical protein